MNRLLPLLLAASTSFAQNPPPPAPPVAPPPRPQLLRTVPPPGIAITIADRAELTAGVAALGQEIAALETALKAKPELLALLPDALIFHKAVDWALRYDEMHSPGQVAQAKQQLEMGRTRAADLRAGKPSWNALSGADTKPTPDGKEKLPAMTVRGYRSKIDGSVQPYGIILPEDYKPGDGKPRPLHFWAHGRGEKLSELDFINGRLTNKGEYTPPGAFVLHLYGRYCCANKFAGEVDLFEALADAKTHYPIDDARLVIRGFSMGGAAVWQFGTHFAGMWAVVQPGAGFAESKEFLKLGTAPDKPLPPEWEQKLWRWYDSTGYVSNLENTTTVAYSGEIDGQKQAADIMIRSAREEARNANPLPGIAPGDGSPKAEAARVTGTAPDLALYHVIAPQTSHKVVEPAKTEVEKLVAAAVEKGRDPFPAKVRFTTYTPYYSGMAWVSVNSLEKQWERADVVAEINKDGSVSATTTNISSLWLIAPTDATTGKFGSLKIDQQDLGSGELASFVALSKTDGKWHVDERTGFGKPAQTLPNLLESKGGGRPLKKDFLTCGPIDVAFMSSFVFVRPSGKPLNKVVGDWVESELGRAVTQWRAVFRGDARVISDKEVSDADIANSNLVLWGDPSSNAILKKIADKLPVKWDGKQLVFAGKTYDAATTAPIFIFPNPLNPQKYVVLNSGFTFREAAALNNAQQTPKLPDWAIIDLRTPPDAYQPGKILRAGFFDEQWQAPAP